MIASARGFADYFDGVRRRTVGFFRAIPADRIDWAPKAGEYTCGDIVRHVAATEWMFTRAVCDGEGTPLLPRRKAFRSRPEETRRVNGPPVP